jgi:hypothetical protein
MPFVKVEVSSPLFTNHATPPHLTAARISVSTNHGFTSDSPTTARSIQDPKSLTLKMATVMFAETLDNLQQYTAYSHKNISYTLHRVKFSNNKH